MKEELKKLLDELIKTKIKLIGKTCSDDDCDWLTDLIDFLETTQQDLQNFIDNYPH